MSEGPYRVEHGGDEFVVVSPTGKKVYWNIYRGDCDRICGDFNEAHSHALTAQAERVKVLEEALREIAKGEGKYSMDQLTHAENVIENLVGIATAALAPPAEGGSNDRQ